ncbi:MAG: AAA family ATPase [Gemmatimonadaceae bacterium]
MIVNVAGGLPGPPRLGGKTVALLAYLAIERRQHSRSTLAALLWGEQTEDHARTSLRQALTQIRHAIGPVLRDDHGSLVLDAEVACDVDLLLRDDESAAAAPDVSHFLTELPLRGARAFEDWANVTRENLRARAAGRLAAVVAQSLARRDSTAALRAADQWCALAPLDDEPAVAAAHVLDQAGRSVEALVRLEAHERMVHDDIGRPPSAALGALVQRLRKRATIETDWIAMHDIVPPANSSADGLLDEARAEPLVVARLLSRAPLQERESEWRTLTSAWTAASNGSGGVVLISGEHGAGKSRLLRDFGSWVAGTGGTVLHVAAVEARRRVPFGLLARLVHAGINADGAGCIDGSWLAELARLEPDLYARFPGAPPAPTASAVDGWRVFEALAQLLAVLSAEDPVLVMLDDLPWCDAESTGLLHALVERTRATPVLWCATTTAGIAGRDSPGAQLARSLARVQGARVVEPKRISARGVRGIVDALGRLDNTAGAERRASALTECAHAESEGIPLFTVALLGALHTAGALRWSAGVWGVQIPAGESLTVRLVDLDALRRPVAARFETLAEDERQILITIALAASPCDVELLSHVHGISQLRGATLCNALCESGLLVEERNAFRCTQRLTAEVVNADVGDVIRRETVRAITGALAARASREQ